MKRQFFVDAGDIARGLPMALQVTPNACSIQTMSRIIRRGASEGAGNADAYKGDPEVGMMTHVNGRPC